MHAEVGEQAQGLDEPRADRVGTAALPAEAVCSRRGEHGVGREVGDERLELSGAEQPKAAADPAANGARGGGLARLKRLGMPSPPEVARRRERSPVRTPSRSSMSSAPRRPPWPRSTWLSCSRGSLHFAAIVVPTQTGAQCQAAIRALHEVGALRSGMLALAGRADARPGAVDREFRRAAAGRERDHGGNPATGHGRRRPGGRMGGAARRGAVSRVLVGRPIATVTWRSSRSWSTRTRFDDTLDALASPPLRDGSAGAMSRSGTAVLSIGRGWYSRFRAGDHRRVALHPRGAARNFTAECQRHSWKLQEHDR